ncbi:cytochrome d ubiquinol oxidase subunit II [Massilia sp. H6]|uniref:cytochrome d ubiquinol oxidase subunit II n=1 Tax=Massilia sp. H6 TaxID=2970464 RepID=UPI002166F855|nr:cytochrome d ubiquinol oxidase subunit II [Massilia sp. H6]UVW27402.1 cytochrome d ubiquinol oxidase subunit II [Massilia sp. H6]
MGIDTSVVWSIIIFFAVFMYVLLDGFDLGIGMLFPLTPDKRDRDTMMNTVAPVWDGNETWLVMGGAGLMAAFPVAYAIILSGLYLPLVFMLIGLVFRGVAFEFRFKAMEHERHLWDKAFISGSVLASFFQGVALGAFLDGITVSGRSYAGGPFDWIAPFPLLAGFGVMIAYLLLGATWLIMKTEDQLHARMVRLARPLALALLGAIVIVSIWTPLRDPAVATRWFSFPNIALLAPVPVLVLVAVALLLRSLKGTGAQLPQRLPFVAALALIFLGYSGMAISIWPHIVPPAISIWEAASPPGSQVFTLVGTLFILPVILMYTFWSYWVFRGKVKSDAEYH